MRIITKGVLRKFWEENPDCDQELKSWFSKIKNAQYQNANEVIAETPKADIVGNNRVVFNICHNKYRLIALFRYKIQTVYIRFIGTHKAYDKIENIKEI